MSSMPPAWSATPVTPARLTRVGQVFVMNMTYREGGHVEHYQSDNHVRVIEPGHAIAWATDSACH